MAKGWTIGGSPRRETRKICHNAICGQRDKETNACLANAPNCRDWKQQRDRSEA